MTPVDELAYHSPEAADNTRTLIAELSMSRQNRQFTATDDQGRPHTVIIDSSSAPAGDDGASVGGNAATEVFRTSTGMRVRRVSKGVYEVIQTWQILRSDDPDAP
jgi:hypothetical protein